MNKLVLLASLLIMLSLFVGQAATPSLVNAAEQMRDDTLVIGGVPIYLGMPSEQLLSKISKSGYTANTSDPRSITILDTRSGGSSNSLLGLVNLTNNKVSFINKSWTPDESDGPSVAKGLYGALAQFTQPGRGLSCTIVAGTSVSPTAESKELDFKCIGRRYISLTVVRYEGQDYVSVSEIVNPSIQ